MMKVSTYRKKLIERKNITGEVVAFIDCSMKSI
jgi:hypothetical protein